MKNFDFLVLGSGIAGLSFALKVAPLGARGHCHQEIQRGVQHQLRPGRHRGRHSKEDSVEIHVRDTLEAGAGLCHEDVVRTIIEEGPARIAS
jgi:L-aspartate oxidase